MRFLLLSLDPQLGRAKRYLQVAAQGRVPPHSILRLMKWQPPMPRRQYISNQQVWLQCSCISQGQGRRPCSVLTTAEGLPSGPPRCTPRAPSRRPSSLRRSTAAARSPAAAAAARCISSARAAAASVVALSLHLHSTSEKRLCLVHMVCTFVSSGALASNLVLRDGANTCSTCT